MADKLTTYGREGSSCDVDDDDSKDHDYADAGKNNDDLLMITMTMLLMMMMSPLTNLFVHLREQILLVLEFPQHALKKLIFHGTIIMQKNKTFPRYACPVHQTFKGLLSGLHKLWNATFLICSASKVKYG